MEIRAGGVTDVGRVRNVNQDSWLISDRLWAVADGMGGHRGGEVASKVTIDVLADQFDEFNAAALVEAAQQANAAVHERAAEDSELRGMGTTLCAMALVDDDEGGQYLEVINIGDSRCYRWRDGEMTQITRDHSLVEDMRAAGQITEEEAAVHPHRNIVTRALGIQAEVDVDAFVVAPEAADRYVLCSDGLFNEVTVDRIAATLRRLADPDDAASELVRQANQGGGRDNITCVVVDVVDDSGVAAVDDEFAGAVSSSQRRPADVAGITTAMSADAEPADGRGDKPVGGPAKASSAPAEAKPRLRRLTWRTFVFVVGFGAIVGVAIAAIGWYARGSYFVGVDAGQVTVFKGRPGKVMWFDPTVMEHTGIALSQVPEAYRDSLNTGRQQPSQAAADEYVDHIRSMICSDLRNGAKPSGRPATAPTTTLPPACGDLGTPAATTSTVPGRPPTTVRPPATTAAVSSNP
ncbi:MAG: Stp1/IreP family PP2C-type Ser/Thr phosphatase [Actinobacteria bacterium]|nr:Stp1/IreP family PP2C-type Ser/Thr phosphatase [Actinomycetota bacterium]